MATADDTRATPAQPSPQLARILHCRSVVHGKLTLAASHWEPVNTAPDDLGAVATVHDAICELDRLYCALTEFGHSHRHLINGPLLESFAEGRRWLENWENWDEREAQQEAQS